MPARHTFDYALIRVVPREERGEAMNVGVILYCRALAFLETRIALNTPRLAAFAPGVDVELVRDYLAALPHICAGDAEAGALGTLSQGERFFWLIAPRNTIVQTSPLHTGLCDDPATMLDHLLETMVR